VLLLPEKTVPTPPCAVQTVAENPHQAMPVDAIAVRETVMPVAVAPTTPVQIIAHDWFAFAAAGWVARSVQVTEPPDADGVTVLIVPACSAEAITTIRSPAVTLKAPVVFGDAVAAKLPVAGTL
jgi:hypothetical protein